ncbi:MAG: carboxypeptidase M32, partial [Paracoccaceae bacterium]
MSAYDDLMAFQRESEALAQVAGRLGWDQETMMPPGAAPQRSEEIGALEAVLHARRTDPRLGDWLAAIDAGTLNDVGRANLRLITRSNARHTKVPADLAAEIARATSLAQGIWARARADEDFATFAPTLAQILGLRRQQAAALADGGDPYDALLDDYEPGMTGAGLDRLFAALRPRLVALREAVLGSGRTVPVLEREFDQNGQLAISRELAAAFGYDFERGRIDNAVHPFSSGSGQDVRITTRVSARNPFDCFYSTIHEVGHASYEQAIDPAYLLSPLGAGASMGVHESQSRIYENQIGLGRAFTGFLFQRMRREFGDIGVADADRFYDVANRVAPGFIRTEADEVHYNLHVMLGFDLERAMIA